MRKAATTTATIAISGGLKFTADFDGGEDRCRRATVLGMAVAAGDGEGDQLGDGEGDGEIVIDELMAAAVMEGKNEKQCERAAFVLVSIERERRCLMYAGGG